MRPNQAPLDDFGGLGIFAVMAKALKWPAPQPDAFQRPDASPSPVRAARHGLLDRLEHWFWTREQRATEAYLAKSQDVFDLEVRIRDLERNDRYRYY
jgi:hypothetical protein